MHNWVLLIFLCMINIMPVFAEETVPPAPERPYILIPKDYKDVLVFGNYMIEMEKGMKRNWKPPEKGKSLSATVLFKLDKNGKLLESEIDKSSGDTEFDEVALKAIRAYNFKPFPENAKENEVSVNFSFDSNYFYSNANKGKVEIKSANQDEDEILKSYFSSYQEELMATWSPPVCEIPRQVVLLYGIDRNGQLISEELKETSKNAKFDLSAQKTMSEIRFAPLPATFKNENVQVFFTFKSHVADKPAKAADKRPELTLGQKVFFAILDAGRVLFLVLLK